MNQIIIVGGGPSIPNTEELWNFLQDKWTLGCNSIYHFFTPSALTFVDYDYFYVPNERYVKNLPFVIGKYNSSIQRLSNTVLLPTTLDFDKNLEKGVYCPALCGVFSLSLSMFFLNYQGEIFLLGFDFKSDGIVEKRPKTHFYQGQINHSGIGKDKFYNQFGSYFMFDVFVEQLGVKVYNVCEESRLPQFEKISYEKFYELANQNYSQDVLRQYMEMKLQRRS